MYITAARGLLCLCLYMMFACCIQALSHSYLVLNVFPPEKVVSHFRSHTVLRMAYCSSHYGKLVWKKQVAIHAYVIEV